MYIERTPAEGQPVGAPRGSDDQRRQGQSDEHVKKDEDDEAPVTLIRDWASI